LKALSQYTILENDEWQEDSGLNTPVPESLVSWGDSETPSASPCTKHSNGTTAEKQVSQAQRYIPDNKWGSSWGLSSVSLLL
jgi:hypothetical protein